jgi:HlyD family secretion protein
MKRNAKIALIALVLIASAVGAVYYMLQPLVVEGIVLEKSDLYDYVEESGTVSSNSEVTVSARTSGQVTAVNVKDGDYVKKGDLLASLDTEAIDSQVDTVQYQMDSLSEQKDLNLTGLQGQIKQQQLSLSALETTLENTQETYDNASALYAQGVMSETDYKTAKQALDYAQSNVDQAKSALSQLNTTYYKTVNSSSELGVLQSQLDQLNTQKSDHSVYAAADGLLVGFSLHQGDYVTPASPIGTIVDDSTFEVETYVRSDDIYNLSVGDTANIAVTQNGIKTYYDGQITAISPVAETRISSLGLSEKRIKVTLESEAISSLVKIGYDVDVRFISEQRLDTIAVPKTALFTDGDSDALFVVENGKAVLRHVETGMSTDSLVSIESGLEPGETIIRNYKSDGLADGKRVSIQ